LGKKGRTEIDLGRKEKFVLENCKPLQERNMKRGSLTKWLKKRAGKEPRRHNNRKKVSIGGRRKRGYHGREKIARLVGLRGGALFTREGKPVLG